MEEFANWFPSIVEKLLRNIKNDLFKKFPINSQEGNRPLIIQKLFVSFFCGQAKHWSSSILREVTAFMQFRNIIERGLKIESELIWSIRIDSASLPCALLGFKAPINFKIYFSSKFIVVTVSFVERLTQEGMELSVEIAVYCSLRNLSK